MSDRISPHFALARSILERELAALSTPEELARGVNATLTRLQDRMSTLVGRIGFDAVLGRAVHLATARHPWLTQVQVRMIPTVALETLAAQVEREGAAEVRAAAVTIVGEVISLLSQFIGDVLAFRLARRTWADLPEDEPGGGSEGPKSHD